MPIDFTSLPQPNVIEDVDYDTLLSSIHEEFISRNPAYTSIVESDPAYAIMQAMAFFGNIILERINSAAASLLISHSTGTDLDNLAANFSLTRNTAETDEDFRQRISLFLETLAPGSLAWYREKAIQTTEPGIDGVRLVNDDPTTEDVNEETIVKVKDAHATRTPNQNPFSTQYGLTPYDSTQPISPTNLPEIPGSINLYIQSHTWTDPTTQIIHQVVPNDIMLQAVRNYLNAEGSNETDNTLQREAINRRFICDTVNVYPVEPLYYLLRADLTIKPGIDRIELLNRLRMRTREFANQNEKINQRIPLSALYTLIDTEEILEINLIAPTSDISTEEKQVPVALEKRTLSFLEYTTFNNVATFAALTENKWTIATISNELYLLLKIASDSKDLLALEKMLVGNRISIHAIDNNNCALETPLLIVRVKNSIQAQPMLAPTYYQIHLEDISTPSFENNKEYCLHILDSIELNLIN